MCETVRPTTVLHYCCEEEFIRDEWLEGIIAPFYKGGDKKDIGNYRGVTLDNHFGKHFRQILKAKLERWQRRRGFWEKHRDGLKKGDRQLTNSLSSIQLCNFGTAADKRHG